MTPIIGCLVGLVGGWVYAGFPLPRRRLAPPVEPGPRAVGQTTVP